MNDATRAVIFDSNDYASGPRRLISLTIDISISIALLSTPIAIATALWVSPETQAIKGDNAKKQRLTYEEMGPAIYYSMLTVALILPIGYHLGMRLTPIGTLGYFLTRIRLVGIDGHRPEATRILKRFALSLIGLFTFGAIYLSCFKRERHQGMHDIFAATWLVKRNAAAGRPARIVYNTKLLGSYPTTHLDLEEVDPINDGLANSGANDLAVSNHINETALDG